MQCLLIKNINLANYQVFMRQHLLVKTDTFLRGRVLFIILK